MPVPGVAGVESGEVVRGLLYLAQHEHRADGIEPAAHRFPEVERDVTGDIGAVAVHAEIADPFLHRPADMLAHAGLGPVEVDDVGPIPPRGGAELAVPALLVPVGVLLRQGVVPGGVVGDEIEDDLEPLRVGGIDEGLELRLGAELGIDRVIVLYGIGAAQRALAVFLADGVDRHQPQDIDAQFLEPGELLLRRLESALGRELARVDLIDHRVLRPFGMRQRDLALGCPSGIAGGWLVLRAGHGVSRSGSGEGKRGGTGENAVHGWSPWNVTRARRPISMAPVIPALSPSIGGTMRWERSSSHSAM